MDPMTLLEEERRIKEEMELREFKNTVVIDELSLFIDRDLTGRGKDVHPSGKQRKEVQTLAETIIIRKQKWKSSQADAGNFEDSSDFYDESSAKDFDLTLKPRVFITSGPINKREPDKLLWKVSKRVLFLFNDVLILATKKEKEAKDMFELQQILWVKDLRLRYILPESADDSLAFEIIVNKTRNRPRTSIFLSCDSEAAKNNWLNELETVFLAYHRDTELSLSMGWFHEIIQGTYFSAAYLGDLVLLRKHLNLMTTSFGACVISSALNGGDSSSVDKVDPSGMSALHWACLRNQEVCARLLLDRGADVDVQQLGMNSPLLLAASTGNETIARLLLERGANINARNLKQHDAVFMSVVYGHVSKGLPWLLQLLNARGLDLNRSDGEGATPLHICAEKNLARPVRMLVDSGADVNAKHGRTQLTPLQMACSHGHPDVETIRSFLDKGAYPNWKDLQGRTAFDLAFHSQQGNLKTATIAVHNNNMNSKMSFSMFPGSSATSYMDDDTKSVVSSSEVSVYGRKAPDIKAPAEPTSTYKWRPMEGTLEKVGDWAVRALPALLEICKKGGRFEIRDLDSLRPSFRAAVMEAREVWEKKSEPSNFFEFVTAREHAGEDLRLGQDAWTKNNNSSICQLCSASFGLTNRRHHCRSCGVLCCDSCTSKRLQLIFKVETQQQAITSAKNNKPVEKDRKKDDKRERVCDGCFNRLVYEASQPSPDHFRVRQLKQCAVDAIRAIEQLIDSLDDPDGDPHNFNAALKDTEMLTRSLDSLVGGKPNLGKSATGSRQSISIGGGGTKAGGDQVDVLKIREARLQASEDVIAKFLEAADGYHRIAKKLIEKKMASNRLWGAGPAV